MIKCSYIYAAIFLWLTLVASFSVFSGERSLEANINTRVEYTDNVFLTDQNPLAVSALFIKPSLSAIIKEAHWNAALVASLSISKYTDESLDGNEQFFDLIGRYTAERNIFSLNINHDLRSNLSSTSTDFGIAGRRIDQKTQSITPQYTRLLTERSVLTLSYTYSDIDFLDAEGTGFTPYVSENVNGSIRYNLTERDELTLNLTAVDYASKNNLVTYQLFETRIGLNHKFTDRVLGDMSVGVSRRNSTNLQTQTFDFFGQPITVTQESNARNRGLVFNFGMKYLFETGKFEGRITRNNSTNSFGGLNVTNRININFSKKLSESWGYKLQSSFSDITSVNSTTSRTDRDIFIFESIAYYSISRDWNAKASYRYIARKFKSDLSEDRAPHSGTIYLGLTYNFPSLLTF